MRSMITLWVMIATIILAAEATRWTHVKARDSHQGVARRGYTTVGPKRCRKKNPKPGQGNGKPPPPPQSPASITGLISVKSTCGNTGATRKTTHTSGPNGSIDWLTCGIDEGGWKPPFIRVQDLVSKSLSEAIKAPNSAFRPCTPYVSMFEQIGAQFNLPPILLASFAMQESGCEQNLVGGAGEQGLMQITPEKCAGAPGENCQDPWFNISTGAKFFADTVKNNGGNVLAAIGQYNGWFPGMTTGAATALQQKCCRCQQNLDYLHQFLNGWLQNLNAYSTSFRLGKYFNLDRC